VMTLSGVYVTRTNDAIPTLWDMAYGLARMPRFGGQTVVDRWCVTDHLLACMAFAHIRQCSETLRLYVGLHDAHEALTGDIPAGLKTDDMKGFQDRLDRRIYHALGVPLPDESYRTMIKTIDTEMLLAEAYYFTPAATYSKIVEEAWGHKGQLASEHGKQAVRAACAGWFWGTSIPQPLPEMRSRVVWATRIEHLVAGKVWE